MRLLRAWTAVCAGLAGVACDFPTEPPILEHRWILPLDVVTLDQSELLPPEVTVVGSSYDVDVADASASESLANLCAACAALTTTVAFQGSFQTTESLPTDLVSADISGGQVDVTLDNDLTFDPLFGGGTITITVAGASGGPVVGTLVFDGAADALPPGGSITRAMTITGGTVSGALETLVEIDHPGGAPSAVDPTQDISLTAITASLLVDAVTVDVDGASVSLTDEVIEADLSADITDGIQSGTVVLEVTNPYGVAFDGTVTVGGITRNVAITAAATSVVELAFTGAELRSILEMPTATFSGSGTINGGPAILTPAASFAIDTTIDLLIELFGN